jgi:oligopeptidase B
MKSLGSLLVLAGLLAAMPASARPKHILISDSLLATRTDSNPLVFKCNMGAGHGGSSGRYDALRELPFDYAWMLTTVGLEGVAPRP